MGSCLPLVHILSRKSSLIVNFLPSGDTVKLRPDHRLVYGRAWDNPDARLAGVQHLLGELATIAAG